MHLRRSGPRTRVAVVLVGVLATVAALLSGPGSAGAAPPPNPSNSQIQSAQQQKNALAAQVGALSAQAAQMQTRLSQLTAQKELAEQKVALALSQLADAKAAAESARRNVVLAQRQVDQAQANFVGYVQASYMSGGIDGTTTGTLLTAGDPNALLEQNTLQQYQASHQLNAVGDMQRAGVTKSNADASARKAVQTQAALTAAAQVAEQQAVAAVRAAQQQAQQLQIAIAANQVKLQAAQVQLATLNNQRSQFLAYQRQQAILAAQRLARQRAAEAAARAHQGGGSSGPSGSYVPPGSGGSWTAAKGRTAVARAERWLGTPYSWAGGNSSGPTYGVCAGDGAFNDCHVLGFDCSGLMMYGWPAAGFAHYAATQYLQGSYHPSMSNLMPGDLVFWSSDGSVSGIHHVAMYVGHGAVVQAPESGSVIQITGLYDVSWGLFGATRPLT